jgi:hypothetical protein
MIFNRTLPLKLPLEKQHDLAARVHAMDFLVYAYVQSGNLAKAKAMETEALSIKQQDFSGDMDRFYFVHVHFPAQFAVETKAWKDAESLTAPRMQRRISKRQLIGREPSRRVTGAMWRPPSSR